MKVLKKTKILGKKLDKLKCFRTPNDSD